MKTPNNFHNPYNLSVREHEVLITLCHEGGTYLEIGDKLCISHRTVEVHINSCYSKFSIPSRQILLVKKAIQAGYYKI